MHIPEVIMLCIQIVHGRVLSPIVKFSPPYRSGNVGFCMLATLQSVLPTLWSGKFLIGRSWSKGYTNPGTDHPFSSLRCSNCTCPFNSSALHSVKFSNRISFLGMTHVHSCPCDGDAETLVHWCRNDCMIRINESDRESISAGSMITQAGMTFSCRTLIGIYDRAASWETRSVTYVYVSIWARNQKQPSERCRTLQGYVAVFGMDQRLNKPFDYGVFLRSRLRLFPSRQDPACPLSTS